VGSAFGTVDADAKFVECEMNGSSELAVQAQNNNNNNTNSAVFAAQAGGSSVIGNVVSSNRSFTFNGAFEAKITQETPNLRFKGKGELVFLSPTSPDSVAGLAFTAYSGLINAIISFVGGSTLQPGTVTFNFDLFTQAQQAINLILTDLGTNWLNKGGIDSTKLNGATQIIHVSGTRRYL
jgi:hypothetical protein